MRTEQVIKLLESLKDKETLTSEERRIINEAHVLLIELTASKKNLH